MNPVRVRCASWNIHRCVGRDGRRDPARTLGVLQGLRADVVALQEVESAHGDGLLEEMAAATGMQALHGPTMAAQGGRYGNALLTRLAVTGLRRVDLSVAPYEPRGALVATLAGPDGPLEVVATHLGLRPRERREQVRRLLRALPAGGDARPGVMMGDFNEWFLWGRPLRWLQGRYARTRAIPTFPSLWPVFSLDRIWVRPGHCLHRLEVVDDPGARTASDHLPVRAVLHC